MALRSRCGRVALSVGLLASVLALAAIRSDVATAQTADPWQSAVGVQCKFDVNFTTHDFAWRCSYSGSDMANITPGTDTVSTAVPDSDEGVWGVGTGMFVSPGSSIGYMDSFNTPVGGCSVYLNRTEVTIGGVSKCAVSVPHTWPIIDITTTGSTPTVPAPFGVVGGGGGGGTTTTTIPPSTTLPGDGGGTTCASDTQLSYTQALALVEQVTDDADEQVIMLAVMTAESQRVVGIVSPPNAGPPPVGGSVDLGLMQLNSWYQVEAPNGHQFDRERLLNDPLYNVQSAWTIREEWGNWNAWTTYTSGAFLAYVDAATDAVLEGADDLPSGCGGDGSSSAECDGGFLDIGGKLRCAIISALRFLFVPSQTSVNNVVSSAQSYDAKVPFSLATDTIAAGINFADEAPGAVAAHRDDCVQLLEGGPVIGDVDASASGALEICAEDTADHTSGFRTAMGLVVYLLFGIQVAHYAAKAIRG